MATEARHVGLSDMKILSFRCEQLNGYLNFDLAFRDDVSFLIGINGSGKTSVLRSIMALLGPDVDWLMNAKYEWLEVGLRHDGADLLVRATKLEKGMNFEFVEREGVQSFVVSDQLYNSSLQSADEYMRDEDGGVIRIRESRSVLADNVMPIRSVRQLPTPIFLGLDRTSLPVSGAARSRPRRFDQPRKLHASLRTFLDESVGQAEIVATEAYRQAQLLRSRRAARLREQILLSLFSEYQEEQDITGLPRAQDIRRYENARKSLKAAFTILGIDEERVNSVIDPFFQNVINIATSLNKGGRRPDITMINADTELRNSVLSWISARPRLSLVEGVDEFVTKFNEDEANIFRTINSYLEIMNSFLEDSEKLLSFREDAALQVRLPSGSPADVYFLSSGERQLFVLITTLIFGDDQHRANTVIIDEPELSLHMKWQEMFVDSLLKANPEIQLILATHSPSIILDRDESCVELN